MLLISLIISLLILIGCQTAEVSKIEIQPFSAPIPSRPILESIPDESIETIKALTINMSLLISWGKRLESFIERQTEYYETVLESQW